MPSLISQIRNGQANQQQQQPISEEYLEQIRSIMRSENKEQAFNNIISQNPQLQSVFQMIQSRGNGRQIAEMMAKQRGVDLNWLIDKLTK